MSGAPDPDILIMGAGTAGMACAIEAARAGAHVLVIDKADRIGGSLHISGGHLSAAGTRRQRARGIVDHPDQHYDDVMRIGRGRADPEVLRAAVDLAPGMIDWLDEHGFVHHQASPRLVYGHEPYGVARTHYGLDEARSVLAVLEPLFDAARRDRRLELRVGARAVSLVRDGQRVIGAHIAQDGRTTRVEAPAVVVATGGYGSNPSLFKEFDGMPLFSVAAETSTGDGIELAREAGAAIAGAGLGLPTFGGLPDPARPGRTVWTERPQLVATERPPWEILVGPNGARFVAEDEPSIDAKERRLMERVPSLTFHAVIDARGLRESLPMIVGGAGRVEDLAGIREGVAAGPTITDLAARAQIEPAGLERTVREYNHAITTGAPDPLGRAHRPAPLDEPPFYAVRNHGATLITFAGVKVDATCAALDREGRRIPGLYAIGEVIGAAATMGNAFCGGMTLTPALAFGRALGKRLGSPGALSSRA